MFERFTDRARLITVEAQEAAVARASIEVEPYHFLLGIGEEYVHLPHQTLPAAAVEPIPG